MKRPRANLKMISVRANVSISSVSRILRNEGNYAPDTVKAVYNAAKELKYRPNRLVKTLQTNKSHTIGIMISSVDEYHSQILSGITMEMAKRKYMPIALWGWSKHNIADDYEHKADYELELIHRLIEYCVDGIILGPMNLKADDKYLAEMCKYELPVVTVDHILKNTHSDFVGTDDEYGGKIVAEHFLEMGHRSFVCFGPTQVDTAINRINSFKSCVEKAGNNNIRVVNTHEWKVEDGQQAAYNFFKENNEVTGIFACNDSIAAGVLQACHELDIKVPENVSLIGFGNKIVSRSFLLPFTTVEQNPKEVGRTAAKLVIDRADNFRENTHPIQVRLKPQLVKRNSVRKIG